MKKCVLILVLIFISFSVFSMGMQEPESPGVIIFAAASTTDILEEAGIIYKEKTGVEIKLNPASSGTCARQLEAGAFADVFVSASAKWIDYADDLDLLNRKDRLMGNRLVLIAPEESSRQTVHVAPGAPPEFEGRLSIADPEHAPAGKYAVEALKSLGWYEELSPRLLPGADVRKAMSVVEFGETELGIVYETDARKSGKVKILAVFPEDSHSPIRYYSGLTKDATEAGADFYSFLTGSAEMTKLMEKYGFTGGAAE